MAQIDSNKPQPDDLDAFFAAADQKDFDELHQAAESLAKPHEPDLGGFTHPAWGAALGKKSRTPPVSPPTEAVAAVAEATASAPPSPASRPAAAQPARPAPVTITPPDRTGPNEEFVLTPEEEAALLGEENVEGKFIAIDPASIPGMAEDPDKPFVLIPAHVHSYVPVWGWAIIGVTVASLFFGVIMLPGISLNRLTNRLGDADEASVRGAMRQLVMNGDERTVRKLYDVASSSNAKLAARLRAVDAMSLIERVPEVDRALLRLELSAGTNNQVREAAIAARRQREAYRTRGGR